MTTRFYNLLALFLMTVIVSSSLCGCVSTLQARKTKTSGFLGDYSQLQEGGRGEALSVFINPETDFKSYTKIKIEPAKALATKDGKLSKMSKEDMESLLNYLNATVKKNLETDFKIVEEKGPNTMVLRMAITEADSANIILDTASTIVPVGIAISGMTRIVTGSPAAVGKASIEMELLDGESGDRIAAAIDRRVGKKITLRLNKFNKWRAIQESYDYWAKKLNTRLSELKAGASSDTKK